MKKCKCGRKLIRNRNSVCQLCYIDTLKGLTHPRYGTKLSIAIKEKISNSVKKAMKRPDVLQNIKIFRARGVSNKTKKLMSITRIKNGTAKGKSNPAWIGGKIINPAGYVMIRIKNKYYLEHRIKMEKKLGRKLKSYEIIHHINGIKTDNRIINLAIVSRKNHEHCTFIKILQKRIKDLEKRISC